MIRSLPTTSVDRIYCKILAVSAACMDWHMNICKACAWTRLCCSLAMHACTWETREREGVTLKSSHACMRVSSRLKTQCGTESKALTPHPYSTFTLLQHNAVHAAFAGFTGITVGLVNTHYVYLPIPVIIAAPRKVSLMTVCSQCSVAQ